MSLRALAPGRPGEPMDTLARDLTALLALPFVWRDLPEAQICEQLADVVLRMVRPDTVRVELWDGATEIAAHERTARATGADAPGVELAADREGVRLVLRCRSDGPEFPTVPERSVMRTALDQAWLSIRNAQLALKERVAAEVKIRELEAVARRASRLHDVTAALAAAASPRDVAEAMVRHGAELFGAATSLLYVVSADGGSLELMTFGGGDESRIDPYRRIPLASELPLALAVRTGQGVWLGSHEEIVASYPGLAGVRRDGARLEGVVTLPLRGTRATLGALAFSFYARPALDDLERHFMMTLASQCGLALERARSLEAERLTNERLVRQRERLALAALAAETLSASLDSRRALAELARMVVPGVADWCAIDELGPGGQIVRIAVEHRDPEKVALVRRLEEAYPTSPDAPHGVAAVLRSGVREVVRDVSDDILAAIARDAEHLALIRSLALTSFAVVPLRSRGKTLGALTLVSEAPRRLGDDDVELAEDLARRAALALENARLYEAAETARAQLHGLFTSAPAAIAITRGRDHRYELANEPYLRFVGRRDLVGRALREAIPDARGRAIAERLDRVWQTGERVAIAELALPVPSEDGRAAESVFNVVHHPTRDAFGAIDGAATFAFDVTEQVLARREIEALAADVARSEARMRALVEATAAIVWTATPEGAVVEISPSWLAFTGQTEAEYRDGGFLDAIHPDDREPTMAIWTAAVGAGAPYAAEYRLRRADGGYAHTLARGRPVRSERGEIVEYVGCNVDITELRAAESAAREHAETVEAIHDLGRVIAAELDTEKVVQAVTDAATQLSGAQFGAFFYNVLDEHGASYMLYTISGVPRDRFARFPNPRATAVFAPTFAGEGVVRVDDITKDPRYGKNSPYSGMPAGHLPVRSYLAVPVVARSGTVIGGIFLGHANPGVFGARAESRVVGLAAQAAIAMDNARLYGDAQRLIQQLEATNRELDQFAYVTSHDLKAPLRGIGSLAEWIEEDVGPSLPDDARKKLDLLRGRVRRLEGLIQGILDYSRAARAHGRREEVDVGKLVRDVAEMLAVKPPALVSAGPGLPVLTTERVALQQVLLNLIGNGLKHARRGDARVDVEARDAGEAWEIRVSDNGPGISPAYHDRVWGIFQTLESRDTVESTGIGLAIVKKIVEARGGRAWIESVEGEGATFAFTWPKREERKR